MLPHVLLLYNTTATMYILFTYHCTQFSYHQNIATYYGAFVTRGEPGHEDQLWVCTCVRDHSYCCQYYRDQSYAHDYDYSVEAL